MGLPRQGGGHRDGEGEQHVAERLGRVGRGRARRCARRWHPRQDGPPGGEQRDGAGCRRLAHRAARQRGGRDRGHGGGRPGTAGGRRREPRWRRDLVRRQVRPDLVPSHVRHRQRVPDLVPRERTPDPDAARPRAWQGRLRRAQRAGCGQRAGQQHRRSRWAGADQGDVPVARRQVGDPLGPRRRAGGRQRARRAVHVGGRRRGARRLRPRRSRDSRT